MNAEESSSGAPTFLSLLDLHAALDERFLQHQEALLDGDLALAATRLAEVEAEIRAHAREEEELLLPVYRRAGPIEGGAEALFVSEHGKMLAYLAQFGEELAALRGESPSSKRGILALLDHEAAFKHLVRHHDLRERNILYPVLDRVTGEEERRALLARCTAA